MAAGLLLGFLLTLPKAFHVWQTGIFFDSDDAMRMVEVRDFMAGQAWFDLVPHRLSPNHPFTMHWSRLIDLPLASAIAALRPFIGQTGAELATRLIEPALLFCLALWSLLSIAKELIGRKAMLPAALLLAGSSQFIGNFMPGHIHHHGAQAALLLFATKLLLDAVISASRAGQALWAGAILALSLGIGLQNLPFVIAFTAAVVLGWAWHGATRAGPLTGFGVGLLATSMGVFLVDVPSSLYGQGACDAFSAAHLVAAGVTGMSFIVLGRMTSHFPSRTARFVGVAVSGGLTLAAIAFSYPACLRDPMSAVDPLLRTEWLADVGEALPLFTLIARSPAEGIVLLLTLLCGLAATASAACCTTGVRREAWLVLLGFSVVGVLGTLWQVRVAASTCAFLVPGVTWLVMTIFARVSAQPGRPALLCATLVGVIANGAGLAAAAQALPSALSPTLDASAVNQRSDPSDCFEPSAYRALAGQPPGLVLSTVDPGSVILAATKHNVLAAPYHRNSYGIRAALLALAAPPEVAQTIVADAQADYIVLCRASNETAETVEKHPDSLSAALLSGRVPGWLTPLGSQEDRILLFRVAGKNQS